jgi:hypothetical protein
MTKFTKHIGKMLDNAKVLVVFRQMPDEPENALVVYTQNLEVRVNEELMQIVENQGQNDMDFYKVANRQPFFDGRNVLESLHLRKALVKVPTSSVTMTPGPNLEIPLSDLNKQLNDMVSKAVTKTSSSDVTGDLDYPATPTTNNTSPSSTLDDKVIADGMRRQALQFESEAKRLRDEADGLDPNRQGRPRKAPKAAKASADVTA